jgi:hypothetical protein
MSQIPSNEIALQISVYGLPEDTDIESLTILAHQAAATFEEMGVFDQREFEPAHIFLVGERKNV